MSEAAIVTGLACYLLSVFCQWVARKIDGDE